LALIALPSAVAQRPITLTKPSPIRFATQIRPILSDYCFACHGPDAKARKADLRLDTEAGAFATLTRGKPFVGGHPEQSRAYLRMTEKDPSRRMPPPDFHKELKPDQIALIKQWIQQGAKWEGHWAYIAPVRPAVPSIATLKLSAVDSRTFGSKLLLSSHQSPIDLFILARLLKENLRPSPQASPETLIRRVSLDLTGLPPTIAEMDAFLADKRPDAYERLVDRLLASPRFGERWVWEWLDAARYSDTNGYQEDRERPTWPWRDWCVNAINRNMPFDQFTIEQIAGDLLPSPSTDQLIATGFQRNCMLNGEGGRIPEESRVEYVVDRVETVSATWLGLTMGCARCHDHKFDPISQRDFYSMYAYFNQVEESGAVDFDGLARPVLPLPNEAQAKDIVEKRQAVAALEAKLAALAKDDSSRSELQKQVDAARKVRDQAERAPLHVMVMRDRKDPRETRVLIRGAYDKPGDKVGFGTPAALPPLPSDAPANRLALAKWLVDAKNPLTARVVVNRMWQTLFGMGLVKTTEDFGVQSERPSHPELLDWLAVEFRECGWDVKRMVKLMVTSETYKQNSRTTPALIERDPSNRLLARGPRYRLPSFVLRDQALAVSGLLVEKLGGPPVKPYQPEGVWEDFSYGKIRYTQDHGDALYRRSLYTFWRRSVAPTTLFDVSGRRVCTVRVERTNTPLQALTLLNDTTFVEAARKFAERAMKEGGATPEARLTWMFRVAAGRKPGAKELSALRSGFERRMSGFKADEESAKKLLAVGESKADAALPVAELAAYAASAGVILNLDEVVSKE
jgi:hypothetical protein